MTAPASPATLASCTVARPPESPSSGGPARRAIPTGCPSIDNDALVGGFPYGRVAILAGPAATGKTLSHRRVPTKIAMHALTSHLLSNPARSVAWIDALGAFSPLSLHSVVSHRLRAHPPPETLPGSTVESVLDRVELMRVFDMYGLIEAVRELSVLYTEQQRYSEPARRGVMCSKSEGDGEDSENKNKNKKKVHVESDSGARLIVIDNITQPLQSAVNKGEEQGHSLLLEFSRSLSSLAKSCDVCVLLLNNDMIYSSDTTHNPYPGQFESTMSRPAFGDMFDRYVDLIVLLSKHPHDDSDAEKARLASRWKLDEPILWKEDIVFEVLLDRQSDRTLGWGAFTINGVELKAVS